MRRLLLLVTIVLFTLQLSAQTNKYQLSTHILDITTGKPSANVAVLLEKQNKGNEWIQIAEGQTDDNGRITDFLMSEESVTDKNNGIYRLIFLTEPYFESRSIKSFYPFVQVVFEITDNTHYHVPITLSPFGYSTYRGS